MTSVPAVRVGPGATALTRIPLGPNSAAQALLKRLIAALLEPYSAAPACPNVATIVETFTITPSPRSAIEGASAPTRKNGTLTLIAYMSSNCSSVVAAVGPKAPIAALLTRMSIRPASWSASVASARAELSTRSAAGMKSAVPPSARVDCPTAFPRSSSRPAMIPCAPSPASARAVAAPIPLVEPVTRAILSLSLMMVSNRTKLGCAIQDGDSQVDCQIHFSCYGDGMSTALTRPAILTPRGRLTRQRIVAAAAELMLKDGVAGTTLDDVKDAAG